MRRTSFVAAVLPALLVSAMQLLHFQVHGFLVYPSLTTRAGLWFSRLRAGKEEPYNDDSNNSLGGALSPPPPFTNPNDLAVNIFSHPWFSAEKGAETKYKLERQEVFGKKTIETFRQEYLKTETRAVTDDLLYAKVEMKRVVKYFDMLDISTRQMGSEDVFTKKFGGEFKTIDVDVGSSLDGLLPGAPKDTRILDLRFLDDLRLPKKEELFLSPEKIYIRNCMRLIFGLFVEDVSDDWKEKKIPRQYSTALIGSPGVGKSILSFCAALYQAQTTNVVYYRNTKSDLEDGSGFVMTPGKSPGKVTVWFNRKLRLRDNGGIGGFNKELERFVIPRDKYYAFVDGPHHKDDINTLWGMYDYLCTSGGFPSYTSEENGKRLWILDGWELEEALQALANYGFADKSEEAFDVCGGSIREMLVMCRRREGPTEQKRRLRKLLSDLSGEMLELVVESSQRNRGVPDALRTMFRPPTEPICTVMTVVQVVDSRFVLREIQSILTVDVFLKGFDAAIKFGFTLSQAEFFEAAFHKWVMVNMPMPVVQKVCHSEGTLREGISQLTEANQYWIPSVSNFPAIDAAMVVNNTLVGFQMTISKRKNTDDLRTTFKNKALSLFRDIFPNLTEAVVYIVAPTGTSFKCPDSDDTGDGFVIKYKTHEVAVTVDGLTTTMLSLFERIQPGTHGAHLRTDRNNCWSMIHWKRAICDSSNADVSLLLSGSAP